MSSQWSRHNNTTNNNNPKRKMADLLIIIIVINKTMLAQYPLPTDTQSLAQLSQDVPIFVNVIFAHIHVTICYRCRFPHPTCSAQSAMVRPYMMTLMRCYFVLGNTSEFLLSKIPVVFVCIVFDVKFMVCFSHSRE